MKNKFVLFLVLILGIVIILVIGLRSFGPTSSPNKSNTNTINEVQEKEKGSVVVEATVLSLSAKDNASFTVSLTTHSGDLDYDLLAISKLTDNKGNVYSPISWTGEKGGHHISGTLTFSKLLQEALSVTLTISKIDNQDRVFEWKVN